MAQTPVQKLANANDAELSGFRLVNRRYIGCKQKLLDWIFEQIKESMPTATSFFDVFAGTGVVAEKALDGGFDRVIVNDLLYSNRIIYEGFFGSGNVSELKLKEIVSNYNAIDIDKLGTNFFF